MDKRVSRLATQQRAWRGTSRMAGSSRGEFFWTTKVFGGSFGRRSFKRVDRERSTRLFVDGGRGNIDPDAQGFVLGGSPCSLLPALCSQLARLKRDLGGQRPGTSRPAPPAARDRARLALRRAMPQRARPPRPRAGAVDRRRFGRTAEFARPESLARLVSRRSGWR